MLLEAPPMLPEVHLEVSPRDTSEASPRASPRDASEASLGGTSPLTEKFGSISGEVREMLPRYHVFFAMTVTVAT